MTRQIENHKRWQALILLCLGVLMIMLDTTIVNLAPAPLPTGQAAETVHA